MKKLAKLLLTLLLVALATTTVLAKRTLPLVIDCAKTSPNQASVVVTFHRPASQVKITVRPMGSVQMTPLVQTASSVSENGEVVVNASFTAGEQVGALSVHVMADFGNGPEAQVCSFDMVKPAHQGRQKSGNSPKLIVVPAQTSTE